MFYRIITLSLFGRLKLKMNDEKKTNEQLLQELKEICNKVAEFETVATKYKVSESDHKRFNLLCDNVNDLKSRKHNAFKCNIGELS